MSKPCSERAPYMILVSQTNMLSVSDMRDFLGDKQELEMQNQVYLNEIDIRDSVNICECKNTYMMTMNVDISMMGTNNNNNNESGFGGNGSSSTCSETPSLTQNLEIQEHKEEEMDAKNKSQSNSKNNHYSSRKRSSSSSGAMVAGEHDTHIWTERERRKKMRTMFSTLHSLLPHLAPKTDKSTIIDEAISYIKTLQKSLQMLQQQKVEKANTEMEMDFRSFELQEYSQEEINKDKTWRSISGDCSLQTWSSPNVVMSVCGEDAQIGICSIKRPGQLSTIFYILEKYNVQVVTAQISGDSFRSMYMIHVHAASQEVAAEAFTSVVGELVMYFSPNF